MTFGERGRFENSESALFANHSTFWVCIGINAIAHNVLCNLMYFFTAPSDTVRARFPLHKSPADLVTPSEPNPALAILLCCMHFPAIGILRYEWPHFRQRTFCLANALRLFEAVE